MAYDIDQIAEDLQREFKLFSPDAIRTDHPTGPWRIDDSVENRITPEHLATLIGSLVTLTTAVEERRAEMSDWLPDAGIFQWDRDLAAWKARLEAYAQEVSKAAPGDREAVLWTVTAPLLFGLFGGKDSKLGKKHLDATTPFSLANQLEVDEQWRAQQWDLFLEDVKKNAKDVADAVSSGVGGVVIAVAVVVVGFFGLKWLSNR